MNLVRMYDKEPQTLPERDDFIKALNDANGNASKTKNLVDGINIICYDFSQHFNLGHVPELRNGAVIV